MPDTEATKRDYIRYLDIVSKAWGALNVASCRPKHVIHLRDNWVSTPVAANMLVAVLRLLIAWGIPREFSESNPCIHVPRLETQTVGARPWPTWAYKLIDECGREDIKRAVMLRATPARRQADVLRMAPEHIEDGGIVVVQQKTGKELWVPLHADLRGPLEGWSSSPYVVNRKERFRSAWAELMQRTPAGRIRDEGFVSRAPRFELREATRGRL